MDNFPDANDRTPNNPCILLDHKEVIKIYNDDSKHYHDQVSKINNTVREWFEEKAQKYDWNDIKVIGGQCLLINKF